MRLRPLLLSALIAGGLVSASSVWAPPIAHAQEASEVAGVAKAREQFQEGVALMAAQDYAGALLKFRAVSRVRMSAQVAFNIAECEEKLGNLVAALGNYRLAYSKASQPDAGAPTVLEHAPARIKLIEPKIARLTVQRVEPSPNPAAIVALDGVELGSAQLGKPMSVDPGERIVRVLIRGEIISTERVSLAEGGSREVRITIPPPSSRSTSPSTPSSSGGVSGAGVALTVVGGASLVLGVVFIGLRQGAISDLEELCGGDSSCPPSAEETYDQGRLYTGLAEVFVPVGVVGATLGIVLLSLGSGGDEPDTVSFYQPSDGPGAGLRIRF